MPRIRTWGAPAAMLALTACASRGSPAIAPLSYSPDTARARLVASGVVHRFLWDHTGPWAIHVVEAKLGGVCGIELRTVKANGRVVGRERTSNLARDFERQTGRPMIALVNADFFLFNPPGVPTGTQIASGKLVSAGPRWPVFGTLKSASATGMARPFIDSDSLHGELSTRSGIMATIRLVNRKPDSARITMYNDLFGHTTPLDSGVVEVAVTYDPVGEDIGTPRRGVVLRMDTLPSGVPLASNRVVFAARLRNATGLRRLASGDTVTWSFAHGNVTAPVSEMIGGFPLLIKPGETNLERRWADRPASFIARNPRTAIGWRADGTMLLVTVDGRQPGYSEGMTLAEMVDLSRRLGAQHMLNLDGGGSTAMVIGRRLINRPSDKEGERPVANAIGLAARSGCPRLD